VLVDGHVHIHPCFQVSEFLDAAAANVCRASSAMGLPDRTLGVLLLTDMGEEDGIARISGAVRSIERWTVQRTGEDGSAVLWREGRPCLVVAAGRQLRTSDGLEVLALLTPRRIPDGGPLQEVVTAARSAGAVPVIPWGFGKWLWRRGRLVSEALGTLGSPLFLGDNGGRPAVGPTPGLLRSAARDGRLVIPGSDPLPFLDHEARVASYGFVAETAVDLDRPASHLRQWLLAADAQPPVFGWRRSVAGFSRDQVRMQLLKARRRSPPA
jgi:hypothetical protein